MRIVWGAQPDTHVGSGLDGRSSPHRAAGVAARSVVAKLARPRATRESLRAFGIAHRLLLPGAFLLPAVELAVAGLLVPQSTARAGALVAAAALLILYAVAVARALSLGDNRSFLDTRLSGASA